jgi:glutaryl-CoA dehydrogenase
VDEKFMPLIDDHFEKATFPMEIIPKVGELGLFGMKLHGYGCAGTNNVQYGLACQELERGDSGLRSLMSVQSSLVMYPIHSFGSEEQKEYWLPRMAAGEKIGCFGLTEPDHGSDPAGMKTQAKKDDKGWVINGAKLWITNGDIADVAVVWARTDEGIKGFLVEKGTKGFLTFPIEKKMSLRASVTSGLIFEDVRIPESNRLPEANGLKCALMCLNEARYGISWGAIGAAMDCYDRALRYSKERIQFGKPIASFQLTQRKMVKMLTEISKMQLLALQVGRLKDAGTWRHQHISMAKMNNVNEALKIARVARNMLGAYGISIEYGIIRHMCNLESVYTYEGTHDIHTLILGEDITKISAFF